MELLEPREAPLKPLEKPVEPLEPTMRLLDMLEVLLEPPEARLELRLMALSELGKKAGSLVRDGSSVCVIVDVDL